jgi:hypothetical protein
MNETKNYIVYLLWVVVIPYHLSISRSLKFSYGVCISGFSDFGPFCERYLASCYCPLFVFEYQELSLEVFISNDVILTVSFPLAAKDEITNNQGSNSLHS